MFAPSRTPPSHRALALLGLVAVLGGSARARADEALDPTEPVRTPVAGTEAPAAAEPDAPAAPARGAAPVSPAELTLSEERALAAEPEPDVAIAEVPDAPLSREEAAEEEEVRARQEEEEALALPPPPPPEWRLRLGAGVAIPLSGSSAPSLRLHQEIEFQPTGAAPFLFGIGGAEYLFGGGTYGSAGARIGAATLFCEDSVVRCQGAIQLVVGALFGNGVQFDMGGEGDVRFLFGPLELSIRVGFTSGGGLTFLHGSGGIGGAF